jgi:four helix bundle protein
MFGFESLISYQCARKALPYLHRFAARGDAVMKNQLRRAGLSILLNIAEATGREALDQRKFYVIARGSALESAACLDVLAELGVVPREELRPAFELLKRTIELLTKHIAKLDEIHRQGA